MNYMYQSYLAHHGIKGQKWGVRRFQNEDGTPTSLGYRIRHNAKQRILDKAISENRSRQKVAEHLAEANSKQLTLFAKDKDRWKGYDDDYNDNLNDFKYEAKISKARVDAWKRREKRLMKMNIDELSLRQVKKATKLKWHERFYPDE